MVSHGHGHPAGRIFQQNGLQIQINYKHEFDAADKWFCKEIQVCDEFDTDSFTPEQGNVDFNYNL